jgi:co-chaperonin GroES (HSP10)
MKNEAQKPKKVKREIPPFVSNFGSEEPEEKAINFTPDDLKKDSKLSQKLPRPTGYRMLILPFAPAEKTKGGIYLAKQTVDRERLTTVVGYVVALGPDAYKDRLKFPEGAWCQEGDWVIFGRYAGARIQIDGGDLRLLNDDEILALIDDPEDILGG